MDTDIDLIEKEIHPKKNCLKKKNIIIISIISCLILITIIILTILLKTKEEEKNEKNEIFDIKFNYKFIQSNIGTQNILVNWKSNETYDISINVKGVENEIIRTYNISETNNSEKLVKVYFGKPKLNIIITKNGKTNEINKEFIIPAKNIGFVFFIGTLPSLIFSLDIFNITKNLSCPIYVNFERDKIWDWKKLPEGIFTFDILKEDNSTKNIFQIVDKLRIWIGQLYEINNTTLFNLFMTDIHNFVIPSCLYSNNIPSENYNIFLISDGTGSSFFFNKKFDNNETYLDTINEMETRYEVFKSYVWSQKRYDLNSNYSKNIDFVELRDYVYIIIKEEKNINWWLTKIKDLFAPNNPKLLEELINNKNIVLKDLNFLFKSLNNEQKEQIKSLLKFNSNYFEEAYKLNKSVMLFAGTYDFNEFNFYDYLLTAELFYNNDYLYYYKAHPVTPIENNPGKIENLTKINITSIDSNIPLEVIFYFNPNISLSGYYTTSFMEIEKEHLKALFAKNKTEGYYFDKFDYFCHYINNESEKYGKYLGNNSDGIVLEFNNKKLIDLKYDFGIYLKNNNSIKYYNYNESYF